MILCILFLRMMSVLFWSRLLCGSVFFPLALVISTCQFIVISTVAEKSPQQNVSVFPPVRIKGTSSALSFLYAFHHLSLPIAIGTKESQPTCHFQVNWKSITQIYLEPKVFSSQSTKKSPKQIIEIKALKKRSINRIPPSISPSKHNLIQTILNFINKVINIKRSNSQLFRCSCRKTRTYPVRVLLRRIRFTQANFIDAYKRKIQCSRNGYIFY